MHKRGPKGRGGHNSRHQSRGTHRQGPRPPEAGHCSPRGPPLDLGRERGMARRTAHRSGASQTPESHRGRPGRRGGPGRPGRRSWPGRSSRPSGQSVESPAPWANKVWRGREAHRGRKAPKAPKACRALKAPKAPVAPLAKPALRVPQADTRASLSSTKPTPSSPSITTK